MDATPSLVLIGRDGSVAGYWKGEMTMSQIAVVEATLDNFLS
jgi:hypothetical protein